MAAAGLPIVRSTGPAGRPKFDSCSGLFSLLLLALLGLGGRLAAFATWRFHAPAAGKGRKLKLVAANLRPKANRALDLVNQAFLL